MKYLLLLLLLLPIDGGRFVKGRGFEGYIFPKEHAVFLSAEGGRFTPNDDEVAKTERVLKQNIRKLNEVRGNQINRNSIIHEKLKEYARQYVGYYNASGQKIIWINCIWKAGEKKEELQRDIYYVDDGGNHYWNVKVNLDSGELYDLQINGLG